MIHLFKVINKKRPDTYELSFLGNGGEEQLTIIASAGQHGKFACVVVAVQVDGGLRVLHQGDIYISDFATCMSNACEVWLKGSTKTWTPSDLDRVEKDLIKMNNAIAYKFEVE